MKAEVHVVNDVPNAFASLVAQEFKQRANLDSFSIALSGGSTARPCYEMLSKQEIDWPLMSAFWGDERCVPLDHEDSNFMLAKEALFDRCGPWGNLYPISCELGAETYDRLLSQHIPLDITHLGMGDDGHTASLFPDSPQLNTEPGVLAVETGDNFHKHRRITFTYEAISQSRLVVFTVMGEDKREMLTRIRSGEDFPAGRVQAPRCLWIVDQQAAG